MAAKAAQVVVLFNPSPNYRKGDRAVASRILTLARGGVVTFMVLGLFWGVSAASAQEERGALAGRLSDSTGAVTPR